MTGHAALGILVSLAAAAAGAQSLPVPTPIDPGMGRFEGTIAEPDPVAIGKYILRPVHGTARWRFELDSLDWREKLTIRITLAVPESGVIVIRRSGPNPPAEPPIDRGGHDQHYDPEYMSALLPTGPGGRFVEVDGINGDSAAIEPVPLVTQATLVRGRVVFRSYPRRSVAVRKDDYQRLVRLTSLVAAVFDPRPVVRPATMSGALQSSILRRALADVGLRWLDSQLHIRTADSVHDNRLLHAYLMARWSHVATVDSASTDFTKLYVRLRGRHAPVTCADDDGRVSCKPSWWPW